MARGARWIDLLDPSQEELLAETPFELHERALAQLLRHPEAPAVRPTIESHGHYVLGILLVAVSVEEEDRVFYQEVDFVATAETIVTVRKTPAGEAPFSLDGVHPTTVGYGIFAQEVIRVMRRAGVEFRLPNGTPRPDPPGTVRTTPVPDVLDVEEPAADQARELIAEGPPFEPSSSHTSRVLELAGY